MNEKTGITFSIAHDQEIIPGCTISKLVHEGADTIMHFALAKETDISPETHPYYKIMIMAAGEMDVYDGLGWQKHLVEGDCIITPVNHLIGMQTDTSAIYTEIQMRKETNMNKRIEAGEVFELAALVPYQKDKIVNMDIAHNAHMKFVVMAFDANTGLSPHSAPGEALIFALDGEAIITYEGEEHTIKKGENFHFAKGGMHAIQATRPFKMALLLVKA